MSSAMFTFAIENATGAELKLLLEPWGMEVPIELDRPVTVRMERGTEWGQRLESGYVTLFFETLPDLDVLDEAGRLIWSSYRDG